MTEREARRILSRPLVFGNPQQIGAVRFLEKMQACVEVIEAAPECQECNGQGEVEESEEWDDEGPITFVDRCGSCDGTGHAFIAADFGLDGLSLGEQSAIMCAAIDHCFAGNRR